MKKLLTALLAIIVCSSPVSADESDFQILLENDFLTSCFVTESLALYAFKVLSDENSNASPNELMQRYKEYVATEEGQKRLLNIYAAIFSESEDARNALELVLSEKYQTYRTPLMKANGHCFMESIAIVKELAKTMPSEPVEKPESKILHVTKDNIQEVLKKNRFVIVDVYTDWCGPCKAVAFSYQELSEEYGDRYTFTKLNADQENELSDEYKISSLPTIIFFKEGKEVGRNLGFISKDNLLGLIHKYFND